MTGAIESAYGPRRSSVVPSQGGFRVSYSGPGLAGEVFVLSERDAHRASKRWDLDGVSPRGAVTLTGMQAISAEMAECWRFDVAVSELHAANHLEIGAPNRRGLPAPDGW